MFPQRSAKTSGPVVISSVFLEKQTLPSHSQDEVTNKIGMLTSQLFVNELVKTDVVFVSMMWVR